MKPEEMIALAEKYERWISEFEPPECLAREYRAIAAGLRAIELIKTARSIYPEGSEADDDWGKAKQALIDGLARSDTRRG